MNFWICFAVGIGLAVLYKAYQIHKGKQALKKLEEQMKNNDIKVEK